MDYNKLYIDLITHAQQNPFVGYTEDHHIQPRCLGGSDDPANMVTLSARQHFIAHWVLTKIHTEHPGIRYAFHMMFFPTSAGTRKMGWLKSRSHVYAYHKERCAEMTSRRFKGVAKTDEHKERIRLAALARWSNPEEIAKQSNRMMGNQNGLGSVRCHSALTRTLISIKAKEHWQTHEHPMTGKNMSPKSIAKMKETKRRNPRVWTEEQLRKISKTWLVTTPEGVTMTIINLRQFCLTHGLSQGNLSGIGHSKGYKATKVS